MNRRAVWVWSLVVIVTALAFSLVVPRLPEYGPQTTMLEAATEFPMSGSFVTLPAGWALDIASTSARVPAASDEGLSVRAEDALWWGSSQDLVARVAELAGATGVDELEIPADAVGESREVWRLDVPATAERPAGRIDVVRHFELVVLVISTGDPAATTRPAVDDIVASVEFETVPLEVHNVVPLSEDLFGVVKP